MVDVKIGYYDPNKTLSADASFIDADTVYSQEEGPVRLESINAPETQHIITEEGFWPWSDPKVKVTADEFQGEQYADEVASLAQQGGYTNVSTDGRRGIYGRKIGALRNEEGESLGERLAYEDHSKASRFDTARVRALRDMGAIGNLGKKDDIFSESKERLQKHSRDSFLGWKQLAVDENELGGYNNAIAKLGQQSTYGVFRQDDVQFRHKGQTVTGEAYNSLTTGFRGGLNTMEGSFFGAASAIGDLIDHKGLYDWGRIKALSSEDDQEQLGTFINDIGNVDSFGSFGRYVSGMTGQMMPILGGLFASGGIGAAVGGVAGAGIAWGTPILYYTGEIYNGMEGDMKDKNVGYAFGGGVIAGTVDRLALNGLVSVKDVIKKDAMKQLTAAYMKKFPKVTKDAAATAVSKGFASSQAKLLKELGIVELKMNKQLVAKEIGKGALTGSVREGVTEVIQEGTIYAAQVGGSNKEWNQDEFTNTLTNAAAGGFILGGGIGGVSGARSIDSFLKLQHDWKAADINAREGMISGTTESNMQMSSDDAIAKQKRSGRTPLDTAKEVQKEYEQGLAQDTIKGSSFKNWITEAPALYFKKVGDRIHSEFGGGITAKAKYLMSTLTSNFANPTESKMAGVNHKKTKQIVQAQQKHKFNTIESNLTREMGFKNNAQGKIEVSRRLRAFMRARAEGKKTPEHLKQFEDILTVAATQVNMATDINLEIVKQQTGKDVKGVDDYFGQAVRLNADKIRANPEVFNELTRYLGYNADQKTELYDAIMGAPEGYQPSKLQTLGFRTIKSPGGLEKVTGDIKNFKGIETLMADNHFDQIRAITDEDINYALDTNRLGENGSRVDAVLMELKKEMGDKWDPRIATWIKDSIGAGRGDYRKIQSKFGNNVQEWVLWFNALTQLDTSTLASLPELAMVLYGHGTGSIASDTAKATKGAGKLMMDTFAKSRAKMFKRYNIKEEVYEQAVEDFHRLGYDQAHSSAAALESSEASEGAGRDFRKKTMEAFFKINLLQGFTDGSRVARLALAGQAIIGDLETLAILGTDLKSNMAADAFARLRDLNTNPDVMQEKYTDFIQNMPEGIDLKDENAVFKELTNNPKHKELLEMFDNAKKSYVDNVLANPNEQDRPLFYSNPHYRLLTQYTGFLSTFTANTLPRLYKDLKAKNPSAQFSAAAAVLSMLALGFLGQEMKDEIYDRSWAETPQGLDYFQRGLQSSGLIGTGERWLDAAHPVYGEAGVLNFSAQKGLSLGDSITNQLGPSFGTATKFMRFIDDLANGKASGDQALQLLPGGRLAKSWDSIQGMASGEYLFDRK